MPTNVDPTAIAIQPPPYRRLRAYAFDPSLGWQLDTAVLNQATLNVPWEIDPVTRKGILRAGPVGEYLEVVDYDPSSQCFYAPVDLNHPHLLAQDGLAPSEGNPQFHQQMAFAVAMITIRNFELALGRRALWSPRRYRKPDGSLVRDDDGKVKGDDYVQRLRIYPHAMREANAYYSPDKKALLFGYFPASLTRPGSNLPGGMVFTCLSHDIVAHETTHALLDGMHRRFIEPTNPDVLAFHEAFADVVALFQHFSQPEALRHQIAKSRGDLAAGGMLGELARQFGQAIGNYGALRDAIDRVDPVTGKPHPPDPADYELTMEPHARGAILVAAVFDAFLTIYKARIADLIRIATNGTGVLPEGDIHPDLVNRLAMEATKAAGHVLRMCIRALDYCPPVDITFGEYLRALITADADIVPDDDRGYRISFVESFRRRGIFPRDVRTLSVDSLRWQNPVLQLPNVEALLKEMSLGWQLSADRKKIYERAAKDRKKIHKWLKALLKSIDLDPKFEYSVGLALTEEAPMTIDRGPDGLPLFEVHSVRPTRRTGPDGDSIIELVVEITQRRRGFLDPARQAEADKGFDLRLMPSGGDASGLPRKGQNLVVVGERDKVLSFRILDGDGKVVVDTDEKKLTKLPRQIADLKKRLDRLRPPHELTKVEKDRVITAVTSLVGYTPDKDFLIRGGCTILINLETGLVRYCIAKNIMSPSRLEKHRRFFKDPDGQSLHATYFGDFRTGRPGEPFAMLHREP